MKRAVIILAFLVAVPAAHAKDLGPDFTFQSLDGKVIDFKSINGAPVVMAVGAAWCPECRAEAPEMQKAYEAYKDKGIIFIGVFGNSREEEIREFIEDYRLTFPVGSDNGIVEAFGVRAIPQTFFFSKDGKCIKRIIGTASYKEISRYVEQLLTQ